jgi:hypothetical protein
LVDDAVLGCAGAAGDAFEALEDPHQFRSPQHVKRQLTQPVQVGVERVEDLDDLFGDYCNPCSNFTKDHRHRRIPCD